MILKTQLHFVVGETYLKASFLALRVEAGTSGSGFCGWLGLAGLSAGCKQDSEPVVSGVGEASC